MNGTDEDPFAEGYFLQHGMPEDLVLRAHVENAMAAIEGALRELRQEENVSVEVIEAARAKAGLFLLNHFRERLPLIMRDLAIQTGHASQH